jgi:hypothetical protein
MRYYMLRATGASFCLLKGVPGAPYFVILLAPNVDDSVIIEIGLEACR